MDQTPSPKNKRNLRTEVIKTVVSIAVLACGAGIFGYLLTMREPPPNKDSDVLVPLVKTFAAEPFTDSIDMVISGTVVPSFEIKMTAEVNGKILTKYPECEAGNFVKANTPLLELDPKDLRLQLASNNADLKQAEKMKAETEADISGATRNIELANEEVELLQSDHDRNLRLRAQGATSDAEVDQSARALNASKSQLATRENTLKSAKARLERMKAAIEVSQARIDQTKLAQSKTTIYAPTNGVIVQEMIQEGEMATVGTHLLTFENTEQIEVLCTLTARDLAWIRENNPVDMTGMTPEERMSAIYRIPKMKVKVYDGPAIDKPSTDLNSAMAGTERKTTNHWEGVLERVDGIGRDDKTKTIPARIVIKEPIIETESGPKALVKNMYVKCKIEVEINEPDPSRQPLAFPATALRPGNFVWIASPNKTLIRKTVEVLDQVVDKKTGEMIAVIRGGEGTVLKGDSVIVSPLSQGTVGAELRLFDEESESPKEEQQVDGGDGSESDPSLSAKTDSRDQAVAEKATGLKREKESSVQIDPKLN